MSGLKAPGTMQITLRVDNVPAFISMHRTKALKPHGIILELGEPKNPNHNPIAEKAIRELEVEVKASNPSKQVLTLSQLAVAVAHLNARIRSSGLSASEIWHRRDQYTRLLLPTDDKSLISQKIQSRQQNHEYSSKSKGTHRQAQTFNIGDLVYIVTEGTKHKHRQRYIITKITGRSTTLQKFTLNRITSKQQRVKLDLLIKVIQTTENTLFPTRYAEDTNIVVNSDNQNTARDGHEFLGFPKDETYKNPGENEPQLPDDIPHRPDLVDLLPRDNIEEVIPAPMHL